MDVWAQVVTDRMARAEWLETLFRWTGRAGEIVVPTVDDTLASMDSAGVDIARLSAWHGPDGSLISNDEVAHQISQAPDRFRGLATVDLSKPQQAVDTIRKYVDGERFVGVRVVPWLWNLPPTDRRHYPVFFAYVEAGVPLCSQIGHIGPLRPSEPGRPIPYLDEVLLDFPDLVIVGGLVEFTQRPGPSRVKYSTNWPMIPQARCLQALSDLDLTGEQTDAFLSTNARPVFNL